MLQLHFRFVIIWVITTTGEETRWVVGKACSECLTNRQVFNQPVVITSKQLRDKISPMLCLITWLQMLYWYWQKDFPNKRAYIRPQQFQCSLCWIIFIVICWLAVCQFEGRGWHLSHLSALKRYRYVLVSLLLTSDSSKLLGHNPDSKVHGANMGPIWGRQDPGGPRLALLTLLSGKSGLA